jgi:hypothetical protein
MDMEANPLPQHLYEKALEKGVERICLNFSGGNDEGYLTVDISPWDRNTPELSQEIEEWAWDSYSYSGAGDGSDYGDDITYDLVNKKTYTESWYMERKTEDGETDDLHIASSKEDEEEGLYENEPIL